MMKKIILFVLSVLVLFMVYVGWKTYQNSTRTVIDVDCFQKVNLVRESGGLFLKGEIDLHDFERVATASALEENGILYICIQKTAAIVKETTVNVDVDFIKLTDGSKITQAYIVSGDRIVVKEKDPKYNYMDLRNYTKKKRLMIPIEESE